MREKIGENVRTARRRRGLTQAQLAKRARVSPSALSKLERGEGASIEMVARVADALGVQLARLLASGRFGRRANPSWRPEVARLAAIADELDQEALQLLTEIAKTIRRRGRSQH